MGISVRLDLASLGKLPREVPLEPAFQAFGTLVKREATRSALAKGGRRFWRQIADRTRVAEVSPSGVTVVNDHVAAAQKQYGGAIEARTRRYLTIPVAEIARGRRASEFPQELKVVRTSRGASLLGYDEGAGKSRRFVALYALCRRTRAQRPDPFWPSEERASELATQAGRLALRAAGLPSA